MTGDPPNPALEGAPLYAYGHSYLASVANGIQPAQRYINRAASRLGMTLINRAISGSEMLDVAADMLNGPNAWTVGTHGIVVLDGTTNTLKNYGDDAQALRGYRHSLRSALRYLSLSSALPDDSGLLVKSGDGTQTVTDNYTGGTLWRMTAGQYGTVTFPFTTRDNNLVIGFAGRSDSAGGEFELVADGAVISHWDTDNVCRPSMKTGRTSCPFVADPILPDGTHKIVIRPTDGAPATGAVPYLDYVGTLSRTPPLIVVMAALDVPTWTPWAGDATSATVDAYNAAINAEITLHRRHLDNVVLCDPRPGWDPATHIGPDGLHPSAQGHAHIADALTTTLNGIGWTSGVTHR